MDGWMHACAALARQSTEHVCGCAHMLYAPQLVCTALTRLSEDDELSGVIRACDGVSLLGQLLLAGPTTAPLTPTQQPPAPVTTAAAAATPANPSDNTATDMAAAAAAAKAAREVAGLRAYVLRALRFLFSMERNRKVGTDACWSCSLERWSFTTAYFEV